MSETVGRPRTEEEVTFVRRLADLFEDVDQVVVLAVDVADDDDQHGHVDERALPGEGLAGGVAESVKLSNHVVDVVFACK